MSWFRSTLRQKRYDLLREDGLLAMEARVLSRLPKATPAIKALRRARRTYLARFEKESDRKGWNHREAHKEYIVRIRRQYLRKGWLVQQGPVGKQKGPQAGRPNPWAMYRGYERSNPPGDESVSPGRLRKKYTQKLRDRRLRKVRVGAGAENRIDLGQIIDLRIRKRK